MKLRTRLVITFVRIIMVPIILMMIIYGVLRLVLRKNFDYRFGIKYVSMSLAAHPSDGFSKLTGNEYEELQKMALLEPEKLVDEEYLDSLNRTLVDKASCLLILTDGQSVYEGAKVRNEVMEVLLSRGDQLVGGAHGDYLKDLNLLVKRVVFTSGSENDSRAYILTRVDNVVPLRFLVIMILLIIAVLVVTGIVLINWVGKSMLMPLSELNTAMQRIAEGDFHYILRKKGKSEIATLYRNYDRMRQHLQELIEEKMLADNQNRELISNITHDLKTPITSIKGYVEGIMDGVADTPEKTERYIKTIYNKANDMDRLINELTIYVGINSNRIPYNFRKINVAGFFSDCVDELGFDMETKNITLNFVNMLPRETLVIADPEQLKRVVANIVGNSAKYMNKEKGIIEIRILDENDLVGIEIEDNGKGISPKEIAHIFERFYRSDVSRNSAQGGSGLGLSIVKKIIEDHGGYIRATSMKGEGTCMHIGLRKYVEGNDKERAAAHTSKNGGNQYGTDFDY